MAGEVALVVALVVLGLLLAGSSVLIYLAGVRIREAADRLTQPPRRALPPPKPKAPMGLIPPLPVEPAADTPITPEQSRREIVWRPSRSDDAASIVSPWCRD